jgi:dihydroxy-acid dehydratase
MNRRPHSAAVTDGDDWRKPQIGAASSWNEVTPCNLSLRRLAAAAKEGVREADGHLLEFGTISVSDAISMGHDGMHYSLVSREVIADSVETVFRAEGLDADVKPFGRDMAAPSLDMVVPDDELVARRQSWTPVPPKFDDVVLGKFARLVGSASDGATTGGPIR